MNAELMLPTRLYGRDENKTLMLDFFESICAGDGGLLLVPGHSGVGKTALVRELQRSLIERNGLFCSGKFEQFQQNVPYFAVQQAMGELWQSIVKDSSAKSYSYWQEELVQAVDGFGQPLIEMNSEVVKLLGEQPPLEKINPHEARHRFLHVLRKALSVFCKPDHPLVFFIDDWQWADAASLDLLRHLLVEDTPKYFLIIAAYRDNEVKENHPFSMALKEIRHRGGNVKSVPVKPLKDRHIREFIKDALPPKVVDIDGLTNIISTRTRGNPFFIHALVRFIHDTEVLWFDEDDRCWRWSGGVDDYEAFPRSVATLFMKRFQRRSPETREVLGQAACLGNRFDINDLALGSGRSVSECRELLATELEKGFIYPVKKGSWGPLAGDVKKARQLRFVHDSVQQAAYRLVPKEHLAEVKLTLARTIWANRGKDISGEILFGVVDNYNAGIELVTDLDERLELIVMNFKAAQRAMNGAAYHAAMSLHRAAGRLLEDDETEKNFWQRHPSEAMEFYLDWSGTEFLEGDQAWAESLSLQAVERSSTPLELAEAQRVRIVQYTLLARYDEAVAAGRSGLQALGIILPEKDYSASRDREIEAVRRKIEESSIFCQTNTQVMSDPEEIKATQLLITMGPPCYRAHQHLWSVLVPTAVNLMLDYGYRPEVGYSHTAMAGLLIWVANDFELASEFQDIAVRLMKNVFESPADQSVFYLMIGSSSRHWFTHMRRSRNDYADAYDIGLRHDNLQYAAYAFGHSLYCGFFMGINLEKLQEESLQSLAFSRTRHNLWAIDLIEGGMRIMSCLAGRDDALADDGEFLEQVRANGNIQVECIYYILRSFSLLVMNDFERALTYSDRAHALLHTVGSQGLLPWPEHLLVRGVLLCALGKADDKQYAGELEHIRSRFRIWATNCPENYVFKHNLVEAEVALMEGKGIKAASFYEAAIDAAGEGLFTHWEGFINERAASFWERNEQVQTAQSYWQQSYYCYESWGSAAKLSEMEERIRMGLERFLSGEDEEEYPLDRRQLVQRIIDKQVITLHSPERQEEEAARRRKAERLARDLTQATGRLREEVGARKAAELELRAQSQQLRLTFDQSPIGIALVSHGLQFMRVNGQICRILDREWQRLHEMSISDVLHTEDADIGKELFERIMEDGVDKLGVECRFLTRKGETVWCRLTAGVLHGEEGQPLNYLLTLEDITEQKQVEQKLIRAREEALEANKSKSRFLANMSHEVRTPINGILGMLQLMKTTSLDDEQIGYADTAIQSCNRLTRLLSDILDLSRVEAGRMEIAEETYDFRELAESIETLFSPVARQKGIDLTVTVDESLPNRLIGDPLRLQQIINNLVGNALKFTENGVIHVDAWAAHFTDGKACRLLMRVVDSGVGIPVDKQQSLFEPFTQAENSYTRTHQGAGLGLSISRELIKLMDGEIALLSDEGVGTTFYITIPQAIGSEAEETESGRMVEAQTKPLKVLLAEDDSVSSIVARGLLQKGGHEVHEVENGEEALSALDEGDYDIVLMDVQMPIMDGVEAARLIRSGERGNGNKDVPIIALTAYVMSGDKEKFLSRGFSDYLAKPLDKDSLNDMLAKYSNPTSG